MNELDIHLADSLQDAICVVDDALNVVMLNKRAGALLPMPREELIGLPVSMLYASHRQEHFTEKVEPALRAALFGEVARYRSWLESPNADRVCLDVEVSPMLNSNGRIVGAVIYGRDVTELVEIKDRAQLAMMMFEHTTEGVLVFDPSHRIRRVNPAFLDISGYTEPEIVGELAETLLSPLGRASVYQDVWNTLEMQSAWHGEVVYRRRDGRLLPTWQTVVAIRGEMGAVEYYLAVFVDLSERQAFEQQLERLVYYDVLTGLPNRALLTDRVNQAIGRAEHYGGRLALLFLDLDRFKAINDTFGPAMGDALLRDMANRLSEAAGISCTVSRYGADQFVLLMPELDSPDQAAHLARKLLAALQRPWRVNEQELALSAGIGIAVFPDDGVDHESLVQCAETAMRVAKKGAHHGLAFFTQDMNQRSAEFLLLDNQMRQGLARNEFRLYYQPQFDLQTGAIIGLEALMRWQHPELGLVPPNRFIPAAEESGLIVQLGEWALYEACRQNRIWQDAGLLRVPVAVNVSALQFAEHLDRVVASALAQAGLESKWLEVEVTESTLMGDVNLAILTLKRLKTMGLRISIDDFGTGYSSLNYLKRFPLDKLKVDRSFVIDVLSDPDDAAITGAIISMAKNLRLNVIAEGVETSEQRDYLAQLGCDEMQGYLLSPPLPVEKLEAFVKQYIAR